jgi:hypothetical protein
VTERKGDVEEHTTQSDTPHETQQRRAVRATTDVGAEGHGDYHRMATPTHPRSQNGRRSEAGHTGATTSGGVRWYP